MTENELIDFRNNNFSGKEHIEHSELNIIYYMRQLMLLSEENKNKSEKNLLELIKKNGKDLLIDIDGNNILTYAYLHNRKKIIDYILNKYCNTINNFSKKNIIITFSAIYPFVEKDNTTPINNKNIIALYNQIFNFNKIKESVKLIILIDLIERIIKADSKKYNIIYAKKIIKSLDLKKISKKTILKNIFNEQNFGKISFIIDNLQEKISHENIVDYYLKNKPELKDEEKKLDIILNYNEVIKNTKNENNIKKLKI